MGTGAQATMVRKAVIVLLVLGVAVRCSAYPLAPFFMATAPQDQCASCDAISEGPCCGQSSSLSTECPINSVNPTGACCKCADDFFGCLCPQPPPPPLPPVKPNKYPTVTAHGMGDSCFNEGMKEITQLIGKQTSQYATCVPTGNRLTDTINGFFMTMDKN